MKKFIFFLALIAVGMIFQGAQDHKSFHKKGLDIAQNSFETGCILEGKDYCVNRWHGNDDSNILIRGYCYEDLMRDCALKTEGFMKFFGAGPK